MPYPQTPEEYLVNVIKSSGIDRNWVATLVHGVNTQGLKFVGDQLSEFQYKAQPGYANIRTAYNWALNWSKGNPPGTSGGGGDPAAVREAWLELITKGKYDPAKDIPPEKPAEEAAEEAVEESTSEEPTEEEPDMKVVVEHPKTPKPPKQKGDPMTSEEAAAAGIRGQSSSIDPQDGVEPGDYSDVTDMMKKGLV